MDDEQRIVEYLKYIINWKTLGFDEVIGLSSGSAAREFLVENAPDLMITDIRMPEVSGLDLAKEIFNHQLKTKVIILSGYNDFSYAQKGIRLGISDYLLKPVTGNDLQEVVTRVMAPDFEIKLPIKIVKQDVLRFFIEGLSTLSNPETIFHEDNNQRIIWTESFLPETLQLKINDEFLTVLSYELASSLSLDTSYKLSKEYLQQLLYSKLSEEQINWSFPSHLTINIESENWEAVLAYIKNMEKSIRQNLIFQIDLLNVLSWHSPQLLVDVDLSDILENSTIEDFLIEYIQELLNEKSNTNFGENQKVVDRLKKYIREHYGEDITLQELSKIVYLHPVTVSRIFKATTGSTISNFVKKIRLEAAADLLGHSNLLVSDIGNLVGYHKTQYFIKLFKKKYGITPQKYRREIRLKGE